MTYKIDEKYFWKNNLGYTSPNSGIDTTDKHTYYDIKRDWREIHKGTIDNCIICSGTAKPSVLAKTAPRTNKVMTTLASMPNVIDHTTEENEAFEALSKPVEPMKFDEGKRDWSLLPYDSIEEIAKVLEFGKIKYAAWNWTEGGGFKYTRVFNASMRHLLAFMRGEDKDPDSGLSHIAHLGCNVLFLLHFILNKEKYNTCDDRRVP